ncbi:MAG: hypothetical protein HQ518_26355 [Rhodopirellula sp.]|nr:hypothetical protein [Rhodopirellula sp.]
MKTLMITATIGAVALAGYLATQQSASYEMMDQQFAEVAPAIVNPDDVLGFNPAVGAPDIVGTVLEVGTSALVVENEDAMAATVAVPATAEVTRNGKTVKLSAIRPGDYVRIDASIKNGVLTATRVAAQKLR